MKLDNLNTEGSVKNQGKFKKKVYNSIGSNGGAVNGVGRDATTSRNRLERMRNTIDGHQMLNNDSTVGTLFPDYGNFE